MPVKQSALRSALPVHRFLLLERRRTCRDILRLTSWGCVSAIDSTGLTYLTIADAHRDDEKRFLEKSASGIVITPLTAHAPMKLAIAGKGNEER